MLPGRNPKKESSDRRDSDRHRERHHHSHRTDRDRRVRSRSPKREKDRGGERSRERRSRRSRSRSRDGQRSRDSAPDRAEEEEEQKITKHSPGAERARGRGRGRGHSSTRGKFGSFGSGGSPKKKLAIGRNVFHDSDSQEEDSDRGRARGRGGARGRGRASQCESDERSGLGFTPKPRENSRWKRWQELSRKKDGEGDEIEVIAKFPSPQPSPELDQAQTSGLSNNSSTVGQSVSQPLSQHAGVKVTVKSFENEEVGILTGSSHVTVLFHINQVWVDHPSLGYCTARELYPTRDFSKLLYPGRSVLCWARQISLTRDCNYQATVLWLEGDPPAESLYR